MAIASPQLRSQVSQNHWRVISVRMRILEDSCLRLLGLFREVDTSLTSRQALPPDKADEIQHLASDLRMAIGQIKSDLGLEKAKFDAKREAGALVAAMTVNVEELDPGHLKSYGAVPETVSMYLRVRVGQLLHILGQIEQALGTPVSAVPPTG